MIWITWETIINCFLLVSGALYFAEQLHNFEQAVQGFALDSSAAAAIGYGHAQLLLEVRYCNL
jgi:hypothetical protein